MHSADSRQNPAAPHLPSVRAVKPSTLRLEGIRRGAPLLGPETLHIDVSNRCNTRCVTCWDHSPYLTTPRSNAWRRQILSWDSFCSILDQAEELGGVSRLILSGMGDPLTHPLIYELIAEARGRGLHVTVLTNLLLADPSRLIQADPSSLLISINGITPASYAAFHADDGEHGFARLTSLLKALEASRIERKHVQVICRETAYDLPEMVSYAAQTGASQITFKLASLGQGTEEVALDPTQREWLHRVGLPDALERSRTLAVRTNLEAFALQLAAGGLATTPIESVGCYMGYVYARITVELKVLFCCSTEVEVGSLEDGRTLAQLWSGPEWQSIRSRLASGQYYDACRQCGKFNQNLKLAQKLQSSGERTPRL